MDEDTKVIIWLFSVLAIMVIVSFVGTERTNLPEYSCIETCEMIELWYFNQNETDCICINPLIAKWADDAGRGPRWNELIYITGNDKQYFYAKMTAENAKMCAYTRSDYPLDCSKKTIKIGEGCLHHTKGFRTHQIFIPLR